MNIKFHYCHCGLKEGVRNLKFESLPDPNLKQAIKGT